jgi:CRISPR/Cas system CSM-associated protein Csm3 (group 7 of RAMP superfamily)
MSNTKYTHRCLSRIVVEATTPLSVGSGQKDVMTDASVVIDVNGFPYIPGTSLAGVLRHATGEDDARKIFGYQQSDDFLDGGEGSKIIFTSAQMIGEDGKVIDGLKNKRNFRSDFYKRFDKLPVRQHVKISDKGVSADRAKFDEQVVFKGTRFCFEIELVSDGSDESANLFNAVLNKLAAKSFSIGSGVRGGLGKLKVKKELSKIAFLDLGQEEHLNDYLSKSADLSDDSFWNSPKSYLKPFDGNNDDNEWVEYSLTLTSDEFFLFGSGFESANAKITPVTESYIEWTTHGAKFKDNNILIPATSLKGALAHRVAFYYNKLTGQFADKPDANPKTGSENPAVYALFGSEDADNPQIGNILFFDIIESPQADMKIMNHVAIDRFTGGAIDGALFSEEVNYGNGQIFNTRILINRTNVGEVISKKYHDENPEVKPATVFKSLQFAINDLCNEMLPLGGGVNRGNGCFKGTCNPQIEE